MPSLLRLSSISKSYQNETLALKPISFSMQAKERLCIKGASGKGKTTLLNIIALIESFSCGEYILDSKVISQCSAKEVFELRKAYFGFIFQSLCLINQLSVLENLILPSLYRGMNRHDAVVLCRQLLSQFKMDSYANRRAGELSGGEKQRIAIIRAMSAQPKIILADEPTGSLDVENAQLVQSLLEQANEERGIGLLLVTHDPHLAKMCPRSVELT